MSLFNIALTLSIALTNSLLSLVLSLSGKRSLFPMYLSADFAIFEHRLYLWVYIKERMRLGVCIEQLWSWRSRTWNSFFTRNKLDWGWSWYNETAADRP